jgi:DNA replication protein DnaC
MHLAQLAWIEERANVCFLGPPDTGKTQLATSLALKACQHAYRVLLAPAQEWVSELTSSTRASTCESGLP